MDLKVKWIGGQCPVQSEGTIDGEEYYFRARYDHWSFSVGAFSLSGWYGPGDYRASWMPHKKALRIIWECAWKFYLARHPDYRFPEDKIGLIHLRKGVSSDPQKHEPLTRQDKGRAKQIVRECWDTIKLDYKRDWDVLPRNIKRKVRKYGEHALIYRRTRVGSHRPSRRERRRSKFIAQCMCNHE